MNNIKNLENWDTVYRLASSSEAIYAARVSGVYRSTDGGMTWVNTFKGHPELNDIAATALAVHGNTVFAGVPGAIIRSFDGGRSWQITALSSPAPLVMDIIIASDLSTDQLVVAATAEDGVFVSVDGGG